MIKWLWKKIYNTNKNEIESLINKKVNDIQNEYLNNNIVSLIKLFLEKDNDNKDITTFSITNYPGVLEEYKESPLYFEIRFKLEKVIKRIVKESLIDSIDKIDQDRMELMSNLSDINYKYDNIFKEEFIDKIIDRINKKQLNK